jgi:hypothetical protein
MPAPLVVFAYSRPEHLERTILSLRANAEAVESDLIVYSDGPKTREVSGAVEGVRLFLSSLLKSGGFRSVNVISFDHNHGLASSVISGVTEVLQTHDTAIVLEDDLEVAPDFLEYMNGALAFYAGDENVWSVSGFSPALASLEGRDGGAYLSLRASSWGWATWKRSWDLVDWEVRDYPKFEFNFELRKAFNRGGRDMAAMLDAQMDGRVDSWAIRWCYSQFVHGMYTVYPVKSRVRNIGLDGSGTHRVVERASIGRFDGERVVFGPDQLDPRVVADFSRSFDRYNKCPPFSFARHLSAKVKRALLSSP